jgi:tRNA A37 threonylcarbamoyladenosine synthetase subunit TsaC/SUA5/YrdC
LIDIYLIQTDTTVGLASKNYQLLNKIKNRKEETKTLMTLPSFKDLKNKTRAPKKFKKQIRRSTKTTFIYPNDAYRIVTDDSPYKELLKKEGGLYSTSANETDKNSFSENTASKIYKLGRRKIKRIR